ncbi:MAG: epoxyqueuosine reductase [Provencibacterium sp.]|nr:epoxyqueuosine reductase [Provencibacterium sp.]
MQPDEILASACAGAGLTETGVCAYDPALAHIPTRARSRIPEGCRSLVVAAIPYYTGAYPHRNLARYALSEDYHDLCMARLERLCAALRERLPGDRFAAFADISPFDEVEAAVRAGVGVRGENGLLINPRYGSYVFIGEIASTAAFTPAASGGGHCLRCGRCRAACPSGALGEDFRRERCRSHLTQQKRLEDPEQQAQVAAGGYAWGCDRCADVCPMNREARYTPLPEFYRNICAVLTQTNLEAVLAGRAYAYKGAALLRRNLALISQPGETAPAILATKGATEYGDHHPGTVSGI